MPIHIFCLIDPSVVKNNDLIESESTNKITKEREQKTPESRNEPNLIIHNNENSESSSEADCKIENNDMSVNKAGNLDRSRNHYYRPNNVQ